MKTIIGSNSRPLGRAFFTLLLGIAALWTIPRSAHAQALYGNVGEYDATTGAAVNANFITGLTSGTFGLVLSDNSLFVAKQSSNTVGTYNATTGEAINANFITGLNGPWGLALSGNNLFVANSFANSVGEYNATTGAAINANFITINANSSGLRYPIALALSGNNLFVAATGPFEFSGTVGEYDATTGVAINSNFITGLNGNNGFGLELSGNSLFVTNNYFPKTVGEYNATTGAAINAYFITELGIPVGLALSGNILLVSNLSNTVGEYNATTGPRLTPTSLRA